MVSSKFGRYNRVQSEPPICLTPPPPPPDQEEPPVRCDVCIPGTTPRVLRIQTTDFVGSYSIYNGTYVYTQTPADPCIWRAYPLGISAPDTFFLFKSPANWPTVEFWTLPLENQAKYISKTYAPTNNPNCIGTLSGLLIDTVKFGPVSTWGYPLHLILAAY